VHNSILVEPMTEDFILWRCLHRKALSRETIDLWPAEEATIWESHRQTNLPLLTRLIQVYGTCAMLAWDGDLVVGSLRFYPKALFSLEGAGSSSSPACLLLDPPFGVSDRLVENRFPPVEELPDKTLAVHCWAIVPGYREANPFRLDGFAPLLAKAMIYWARQQGWKGIELKTYQDTPLLNTQLGAAGRRFWEKFGFQVIKTDTETAPWFLRQVDKMREQLVKLGGDPQEVQNKYTMRLDLMSAEVPDRNSPSVG